MAALPTPLLRALSLLPLLSLPMLSLLVAAADGSPQTRTQWGWPLDPTPAVVAPFDLPADPWRAGHRGVDLAASVGQRVRTPQSGTVSFAGVVAGRPVVVVTHPDGLRSTLEPVLPTSAVGTSVPAGAVVGTIAATPGHCAPATCLHWGVLRGTTYLDPLVFVAPRRVILLPSSAGPMLRGPPVHRSTGRTPLTPVPPRVTAAGRHVRAGEPLDVLVARTVGGAVRRRWATVRRRSPRGSWSAGP